MSNRFLSIVFKIVGILYAVLVGGVALLMLIFSFGSASEMGIGLGMFLLYGSIAFVALTMFWGYSNVLADMDDLRETNRMLTEQNRKIIRMLKAMGAPDCEENSSGYNLSEISSSASVNAGMWECPHCGQKNPNSQRNCRDCGYQK